MSWYLVLDDLRELDGPDLRHLDKSLGWTVARTVNEAVKLVQTRGCPVHIAFDHDLGLDEQTGKPVEATVFMKWLTNEVLEGRLALPANFDFSVHSSNPGGRQNIESYMRSFLKTVRGE